MDQWEAFLQKQEESLGKEIVAKWLRSLKIVHFDACNLYLQAEDAFQISWFDQHLRHLVQAQFVNNNNHPIKVHLSLQAVKKNGKPKTRPLTEEQKLFFKIDADPLSERATFESFIPGKKNQPLYQFLLEIPQSSINPIFIYGTEGVGKTHLLMASAKSFLSKGISAFYVHADTFTEHVVKAIRSSQMQEFRKIYRHQQVLIIDDVHLLAGKGATQEELFHTFNTFHTQGRQIILSSQLPPARLTEIEPRLVSRFEWGILFHLEKLEFEELRLLVKNRFKDHNVLIEDDLIDFLLTLFSRKMKIVVEAVNQLIFEYKKLPVPFSKEKITDLLQSLIQKEATLSLTPEKIVQMVADYFGVRPSDVLGKSQTHECTLPRQIAMELCRTKLKMAYLKIGHVFSRDHSTVMFGIKQAQKKKSNSNSEIALAFQELERQLEIY